MYIKDWFFTVTLYIFTDCCNSYRNSWKLLGKLVRRINTLSRRFEWWYFQKDRISISIWKLGRKMRKFSIVEKFNFTWFCKGNSFRKIKGKSTFGKLKISPFSIEFFHLTRKFSYGNWDSIFLKIPPFEASWQSVDSTYQFSQEFSRISIRIATIRENVQGYCKIWYIVRQSYL